MTILQILNRSYQQHVSDLHIVPNRSPRVRINGEICALSSEKVSEEEIKHFVEEQYNGSLDEVPGNELDFSFCVSVPHPFRVRAHFYRSSGSYSLAMRILPTKIPTPTSLGIAPSLIELVQQPSGLILFTGPTGSGKTTSVASLVEMINQASPIRILTLEDPIEYLFSEGRAMVEQREIGVDTASFQQGIYTSFRQDPDLIMIGELREIEAMEAALRAADAGKLVLATMHASRSIQAIFRYIVSFPDERQNWIRSQLADVLIAVVNQRLIRVAEQSVPVLIQEVLVCNSAVRNLIRSNQLSQISSVMETGQAEGMQTLEMAYKQAIRTGKLPNDLHRFLPKVGLSG